MAKTGRVTISLISVIMLLSCARKVQETVSPALFDGKYDSEFPYRSSSSQLEEISRSVKMVSMISFYASYELPADSENTAETVKSLNIEEYAISKDHFNSSASGTATIIFYQDLKIGLITCAHVVNSPDTIITYHTADNSRIKTVAIKERQINYIPDLPEGGDFEILMVDESSDIAIIGKKLKRNPEFPINVFKYPLGRAKGLEWGNFVYMFSYPSGQKMISSGIVSNPGVDKNTTFMIDAPFNRGSSGGIVLAIRDGIPNFELVGIANSVAAQTQYFIGPAEDLDFNKVDLRSPFTGESFIKQSESIRYGVTHVISIEEVIKSLKSNSRELAKQGYDLSGLYRPQSKPGK